MSKNHFPGADITAQYWAGKFVGSSMDTNCVCLHTTETSVWPGYGAGASAPHMTVLPNIKTKTVSIRQHFPAGKSSRALVNLSGGVETNTLNVFQIELIGTCDSRYRVSRKEWGVAGVDYIYWPDAPDWLLEAIAPIFQWLDAEWANFTIADATPRGWVSYPASYGINAAQRMTFAEWRNAYGIFGHQHVPENTHGDPGNFPIDKLVAIATSVAPAPPIDPPVPPPPDVLAKTLSGNLGAYDKVYGMRTRVQRAQTVIPAYLDNHQPDWFHFQECSADMLPALDAYMKKRSYRRVSEGGKGRESWYDTKAGIEIVEARLLNVSHMLGGDTKEHLVIAYTKNGVGAVDVNFHNENEGSAVQPLQLRDVMTSGRKMADRHGYPRANILVTGDANLLTAAAFAKLQGWSEVIYLAKNKIDLQFRSTNGWLLRTVLGRRIDVDVVQRDADVLEAEQHFAAVNGKPITDHWLHRVVRRLKK